MSKSKSNIKIPENLLNYCRENQKAYPRTSLIDAHITTNISVIAGLLGNMCKVQLKNNYSVYGNLYSYLVGASGVGKSVYLRPAVSFIGDIEHNKNASHCLERKNREIEYKKIKEENKERSKSGLELIKPEPVLDYPAGVFNSEYTLSTMDFTIEGLQEMAAVSTGGNIFFIRDEFGGTIKLFRRVGRENDISFLIEGHEGISKTYTVTRKMKESKIPPIYNLCINILGGIQLSSLQKHLSDYESEQDRHGFYARFQNLCVLPEIDEEQETTPVDKANTAAFETIMSELVEERVKYSKVPSHQVAPQIFRLTEEAEYYYMNFFHKIKNKNHENEVSGNKAYQEHLQKAATFALKIALVFHILQKPAGQRLDNYHTPIDFDTMKAAIDYANTKLECASVLYRVKSQINSQIDELSEKLFKGLRESNFYKKNEINYWTSRELYRTELKVLPRRASGAIDKELLEQALGLLATKNKLSLKETTLPKSFQVLNKYSFYIDDESQADAALKPNSINTGNINTSNEDFFKFIDGQNTLHEYKDITKEQWQAHALSIKSKVDLRHLVRDLAKVELKNNIGKCPFHNDKSPSLSVSKDKYNCFVCPEIKGGVFNFVMQYLQCDFYTALQYLERYTGTLSLVESTNIPITDHKQLLTQEKEEKLKASEAEALLKLKKSDEAQKLYKLAKPTNHSSFYYFKNRLGVQAYASLAESLEPIKIIKEHYHSEAHPKLPIMVWPIKTDCGYGEIIGVHRTYLTHDLTQKSAVLPNKKIKGNYTGGAILLKSNIIRKNVNLIIAEGIETALSAAHILIRELGSDYDIISSINASNLINFDKLLIKQKYKKVIIASDNDEVGLKYATDFFNSLKLIGVDVALSQPQAKYKDFNDELKGVVLND